MHTKTLEKLNEKIDYLNLNIFTLYGKLKVHCKMEKFLNHI